jgi:hypothetical protein
LHRIAESGEILGDLGRSWEAKDMIKNMQKKIMDVVEDKAALGGRTLDAHLVKTRWKIRDSSHIRCEILKFRKIML